MVSGSTITETSRPPRGKATANAAPTAPIKAIAGVPTRSVRAVAAVAVASIFMNSPNMGDAITNGNTLATQ
ncbi:hypothetical protein FQZ97_897050 [compost metagenome]